MLAVTGITVSGGAFAIGSGAFTSASVNRGVSIDVESDSEGYLSLDPGQKNGEYINNSDNLFNIDLTGSNDSLIGSGLNPDSLFAAEEVFQIQNLGSQAVDVTPSQLAFLNTDGDNRLLFVIVPETTPKSNFPTVSLEVGQAETYGVVALVGGSGGTELNIDEKITISAEAK